MTTAAIMTNGLSRHGRRARRDVAGGRVSWIGTAGGLLAAVVLAPPIVPEAGAVVVCQRTNRRGVAQRVTLQPGPACRGRRTTLVLDLQASPVAGPGTAPGVVGIGSIVAHSTHLPGSTSVPEMQARGFALCNGTTPAQQGITDAVLTGNTPNLNGDRRFLRGTVLQTGEMEDDATAINDLTIADLGHAHQSGVGSFCGSGAGPVVARAFFDDICNGGLTLTQTAQANVALDVMPGGDADETRPANMSVLWMIRVR